jgi:hypothetical protein
MSEPPQPAGPGSCSCRAQWPGLWPGLTFPHIRAGGSVEFVPGPTAAVAAGTGRPARDTTMSRPAPSRARRRARAHGCHVRGGFRPARVRGVRIGRAGRGADSEAAPRPGGGLTHGGVRHGPAAPTLGGGGGRGVPRRRRIRRAGRGAAGADPRGALVAPPAPAGPSPVPTAGPGGASGMSEEATRTEGPQTETEAIHQPLYDLSVSLSTYR